MENAEAFLLLVLVGGVVAFLCRTGVHAYFRPEAIGVRVLPPRPLPAELDGPAADLEELGFRRFGFQVERLPLAIASYDESHAFVNAAEGTYANLAVSSLSDLPMLYFFSPFADGAWAWTMNHELPVVRPELVGFSSVLTPGLATRALLAREAAHEDVNAASTIQADDLGAAHEWVGHDFRARGFSSASWNDLPILLQAHRESVQLLAATHGPPHAEATPETRVAAAHLYYSHPATALQTRVQNRSTVQMFVYALAAVATGGIGALISWLLTR